MESDIQHDPTPAAPNKERLTLWAEALESGNYQQGYNALCHDDNGFRSYCCLGVACEVAIANGLNIAVEMRDNANHGAIRISYDQAVGALPESVWKWYGFINEYEGNDPRITPAMRAIDANDANELDFRAIASLLRTHYGLAGAA